MLYSPLIGLFLLYSPLIGPFTLYSLLTGLFLLYLPLIGPFLLFSPLIGQGRYLVTVGRDQTARIHAPWSGGGGVWQEVARPQVHGYDMSCVTMLPGHRCDIIVQSDGRI